MTDRERLLQLYKDLKSITIPVFDNKEIQLIAEKVKEGITIILDWLQFQANKHFNNK